MAPARRVGGRRDVVCGIDVGSTNTKVVALDEDGRVVLRVTSPTPRRPDGLLQAGEVMAAVEAAMLALGESGHRVVAASCAGVGEDGLLVDGALEPLTEVLPWFDPRREPVFKTLAEHLPDVPGLPVTSDAGRSVVGWWWARHQDAAALARSWVALADWPAVAWTGCAFMSDTLAARTAAWLPWNGGWAIDRVLKTLGDTNLLPNLLRAGDVVGDLHSVALAEAGALAPNAVVVAGGHDHPIGGWGVQQLSPHAVVDSMGTAEVVVAQSPRPAVGRTDLLDVGPAILGAGTSVLAVQELARNIAWAGQDPAVAEAIDQLVAGTATPTDDVHGDTFRPGTHGGPPPTFTRRAPASAQGRASAVLGALARSGDVRIRAVADTLESSPDVFATGGWARSAGWMAIKESATRRTFRRIREPEVTAVAVAMLAGRAIGWQIPAAQALGEPSLS